jgi:hypothetical protein
MFQSQYFPGPQNQMSQSITSPVIVSHTGAPSPTYASNVGDGLKTSTGYLENPYMVPRSHDRGTTLVTTSHINSTSLTYVYHVGYESPTFSYHVDSIPPAIVNDNGTIDKPKHLRRKPEFLCMTFEGSHLTHLCLAIDGIPETWCSPKGPLNSEASLVSPHIVPPIDTTIIPL